MKRAVPIPLVVGLLAVSGTADASTFQPKTNNEIVALDLRSGKELWKHRPARLSDAHFEVHPAGVIAYPHYSGHKKSSPINLDWRTGKRLSSIPLGASPLARSTTFHPHPLAPVTLSNGWQLRGFRPGYSKHLRFVDLRGRHTFTIRTAGYPHKVAAWRNLVFWAYSYLSPNGVLYAHRAGRATPLWRVDLNNLIPARRRPRFHGRIRAYPLRRMSFQVFGNTLFVNAHAHVFAIDPATGKLRWHRNLARDLKLTYHPHFFGGALDLAVFAKSGSVLVISFERRVVAIDLARMKILWHLQPDTFPHCPFPVIYKNRVILTAGANRKLVRVP